MNPQLELSSDSICFKAIAANQPTSFTAFSSPSTISKKYYLKLQFYAAINPEISKFRYTNNGVIVKLQKSQSQSDYWPTLTNSAQKLFYVKTDFDKWVDQNDQENDISLSDEDFDYSKIDFSKDGLDEVSDMFSGIGGSAGNPGFLEAFKK